MPLDRSTRTLIAAFLWVAAAFIIMNNIIGGVNLDAWLLPLLFVVAGALVYFLPDRLLTPGTWKTEDDTADTQARSDALATVGSLAPAELQDPVENMLTTPTFSLEETDEVASPPTAYIASPAPEINAPTTAVNVPATLDQATHEVTPAPAAPSPEPVTTANESGTESTDTQERSDAIATVGSPAPAELQDPVENMLTTPTATLEESDEVSSSPTAYIASPAPEVNAPTTEVTAPATLDPTSPEATPAPAAPSTKADDLTLIEGIGAKMSAALIAAGITSFDQLANTSEDSLRSAISAAGMRFSPSLVTWPEQAAYAARGDLDGMRTFQKTLTSGRRSNSN